MHALFSPFQNYDSRPCRLQQGRRVESQASSQQRVRLAIAGCPLDLCGSLILVSRVVWGGTER